MNNKWKMITLLVLIPAICQAHETGNALSKEFIAALNEKSRQIETITCDFTHERKVAVLANEATKEGVFHYKQGGMMCLAFNDGDKITMNGELFSITTSGKTNTMSMDSNPMLKQMERVLSACVTGNIEALLAGNSVGFKETQQEYLLTINADKRKEKKFVKAFVLRFDKLDMTLNELRLEEPSGDYTKYEFFNKKLNKPLPDSIFEIRR